MSTQKSQPVSVRLAPEVKAAMEKAAKEDSRSISNFMEKVLTDWLRERGFLDGERPQKKSTGSAD